MYAKSKPNMNVPSDLKSREKLAGCVYEYLHFMGAKKAAESFIKEVQMDTASFQLNDSPGFLASWWCVFWDLYNAAPERRMSSEHSMEARAFQDYLNPGMPPYHMQPLNPGMPQGPGSNMVGPDVGVPNFYMASNQMRPPMQQSQQGMGQQMPPMGGMPQQQQQQQQVFMSGPRYPTRPQMRMEMAPGVPPQQQNMNPAMHRVSPGAARMPGPGAPPPNAAVQYGMRPGMPPQNAGPVGNLPMGMPHNQPRPWPPMGGGNAGPGPQAYSTPPPGSIPPGYPPLTPSNSVPPQHPNVNAQGMLSSPVQEMPPNGTDMYGNANQMGMSLQRMPSTGQLQPQYMPGQNMDMMGSQMSNVQPGGGISQAPTPLQGSRGGPQTPQGGMQGMPPGQPNNGPGDQISGLMNGSEMDAVNKTSQQQQQQQNASGKGASNPVAADQVNNQVNNQNSQQHQQDVMGNPSGGAPYSMFPHDMEDTEAILKYKQSLQDDVRRFEQTSTRNQLTPGSSGPNSVQAQQQQQQGGAATNGGPPAGLERPLSSGGVNGGPPDQSQQQAGMGNSSGPQISDYLFQS